MMVFRWWWWWCGPVSRTLPGRCTVSEGREEHAAAARRSQVQTMGPGHSLESSHQQTACAGATRRITNQRIHLTIKHPILYPVIACASCVLCYRYRYSAWKLLVTGNTKSCAGHELIELRNRDKQRSCFIWCPDWRVRTGHIIMC